MLYKSDKLSLFLKLFFSNLAESIKTKIIIFLILLLSQYLYIGNGYYVFIKIHILQNASYT